MLSDGDLKARLNDFQIKATNPNFPFETDKQIQPCSIDLRLDAIVWKPRRFTSIALSDKAALGSHIERAFRRKTLDSRKGYVLRPGEFLLGRTYESFCIPNDLAGRLVGRSSLGRLGLSVASLSNFINPGWRGHMPLLIINESPFRIRIDPYLGMVQLCFFALSSPCEQPYGAPALGSKYIDDDGGPSKYWLDQTISALRNNLNLRTASPEVEKFLESYSKLLDEPTRKRFAQCIQRNGVVSDADGLIAKFIQAERFRGVLVFVLPILVAVPLAVLVSWLPALLTAGHLAWVGIGAMTILAVALLWWGARIYFGNTISPSELRSMASEARGTSESVE